MIETKRLTTALRSLPQADRASIRESNKVAGDASGRRYSRLLLDNAPYSSLIVMDYKGAFTNTLVAGAQSEQYPFVPLAQYFEQQGVPISKLILHVPDEEFLFVEDVGDMALWQFAYGKLNKEGKQLASNLGESATEVLFTRAVETLQSFQRCKEEKGCLAFTRALGYEQYKTEALRFVYLYLEPNGAPSELLDTTATFLEKLCQRVASHPHTTSHRDFMAWNIHVLPSGEIRLIDFQDALQASHMYDLVSLLHDRDIDHELGDALICKLFDSFAKNLTAPRVTLQEHYTEVLLQRHFRLAGQFLSLTEKTGNPQYAAWVPGSLKRLGRFLAKYEPAKEIAPLLSAAVPEIHEGMERPFSFIPES